MTTEIGKTYVEATTPGSTASTKRICSVAYATDEMASEDSTASAVVLLSFSSSSRSEASGRPTSSRLLRMSREGMTVCLMLPRAAGHCKRAQRITPAARSARGPCARTPGRAT